jgi:hypothetical protein
MRTSVFSSWVVLAGRGGTKGPEQGREGIKEEILRRTGCLVLAGAGKAYSLIEVWALDRRRSGAPVLSGRDDRMGRNPRTRLILMTSYRGGMGGLMDGDNDAAQRIWVWMRSEVGIRQRAKRRGKHGRLKDHSRTLRKVHKSCLGSLWLGERRSWERRRSLSGRIRCGNGQNMCGTVVGRNAHGIHGLDAKGVIEALGLMRV